MSNIFSFQLPKYKDLNIFVIYEIERSVFGVSDCWLDKISNLKTSLWALGNCEEHFLPVFDSL